MFDIGWTELMVIGIVALIVIGPKDLPEMFRTLGRFTAKARGMAREFSRAMESAADEAGVKDVADDLRKVTSAKSMGLDAVKNAASKFEAWDPLRPSRSIGEKAGNAKRVEPKADPLDGPDAEALADAYVDQEVESVAPKPKPTTAPAKRPRAASPVEKPVKKPAEAAAVKPAAKKAASPKTTAKTVSKAAPKTVSAKPKAPSPKPAARKPSPKKSDA